MIKEIYTLQVGEKGQERLNILNRIYNPASEAFLLKAGLTQGMHVLEIGAGTGEMAVRIANIVGTEGKLVVADNSLEQLKIAKDYHHNIGLHHIDYLHLSVNDLNQHTEKYNLIYSRWLLMHLTDPLDALSKMREALSDSGILVCEDGSNEGCFSYPFNSAFDQWLTAWRARFTFYKKDYNSGLKLYSYLQQLNFKEIKSELFQPLFTQRDEKKAILLNAIESEKAILDCGFMTKDQFQQFVMDLEKLVIDDTVIGYLRNMQVSGIK